MKKYLTGALIGAILALLILVHINLWRKVKAIQTNQIAIARVVKYLQKQSQTTLRPMVPQEKETDK